MRRGYGDKVFRFTALLAEKDEELWSTLNEIDKLLRDKFGFNINKLLNKLMKCGTNYVAANTS